MARPSKLDDSVVSKLEEAFAIDATVEEACYYADISRDTYYRWIKENPALSDKFDRLRERPVLTARQTVANSLSNPEIAKWYLERKKKSEFSSRSELTGKDGEPIGGLSDEEKAKLLTLLESSSTQQSNQRQ